MGKSLFAVAGLAAVLATEAQANCLATVNGRPMTSQECEMAPQIYGSYPYGHYLRDAQGNWVNLCDWSEQGNVFLDARPGPPSGGSGGGGHWSDGPGLQRTPVGSVGGGFCKGD
jgi:hypothetical protein